VTRSIEQPVQNILPFKPNDGDVCEFVLLVLFRDPWDVYTYIHLNRILICHVLQQAIGIMISSAHICAYS
jgi:hypothetical protein